VVVFLFAALIVAAIAAWKDARTGHIPNWLTFGALVAGLLGHVVAGWKSGGWHDGLFGLGFSSLGALLCSAVPIFMYWRKAIGGGDLKLFAALGAICLPMAGLEVETYSFIAAALIAPAKLAYDGVLLQTVGRSVALVVNPFRKAENRRPLPSELMTWFRLGPAIFVGAAITLLLHWDLP
jgi:prepilin peptidase CpaA